MPFTKEPHKLGEIRQPTLVARARKDYERKEEIVTLKNNRMEVKAIRINSAKFAKIVVTRQTLDDLLFYASKGGSKSLVGMDFDQIIQSLLKRANKKKKKND